MSDRIPKSALYEHRGLFLVALVSKNSFSLSFCELFAGFFQFFHFKFISSLFCCFLSKKEQKVRFQTDFQGKPNITERQFSQNLTVFNLRYSVLFYQVFSQKRNKREISGRFSGKYPYNRTTMFPKRNGFL